MDADFTIDTDRTILRAYRCDDLDEHVAILSNWQVTKWLSTNIPFPYDRKIGEEFIESEKANFTTSEKICFSIIEKTTMRHMGGFKLFSYKSAECEVGYWLGPDFWNKSYGFEILNGVVKWLRGLGHIKRLVAQTANENIGSRKILEKCGFNNDGHPPSEYARTGHGSSCSEFYVLNLNQGTDA